ncbi:alpha/beta fold hydrolase [Candidatus Dependentiae bacterium]|nr:alpha/beta fold hydrolase [Candidatus Dependentiae bacterium]
MIQQRHIKKIFLLHFFSVSALVAAFDFPAPTGEYAVGTTRYHMIDRDRLDPYDQSLFRELMVQVWYPTSRRTTGATAPYLPDVMPHMKRMANETFYVPQILLDYLLVDIKCHAFEDAPLLARKQNFPVIVLCHGLSSLVSLHTAHAENLASHGFIVFGINHTFTCSLSIFPDGRMYPFKFDWYAPDKCKEFNKIVNVWQQDVRFVLNRIEDLNNKQNEAKDNIFHHKLDLDKIGMFGHSMGGATSTQVCRRDDRVKAAVNMDGPLFGGDYEDGFKKPYMVMVADGSLKRTTSRLTEQELVTQRITREEELYLKTIFQFGNLNLCGNIRAMGADAYYVCFSDSGHNTFTDVVLVKEASLLLGFLEYLGLNTGTIPPLRAMEIVNKLLVDFFNKHLSHKPALLLESKQYRPYKEIIISH